ncbi:hypothetical protein [Oricola cellulosilytica]|uniref:Uncharacterized protein n=1 Tax=Oricola cellulosilytica TaxID=1429082 RepID=A0A4R0PCN2_9HYPH|nr:hypothetical protein [Oricola cellulosilytica]TCD14218.1 hypothetical protein E0D97_09045 [Oricola cellulosilytica]
MKSAEITTILGPVDEALATAIVQTGATPGELASAWAWINNDEALINDGRELPSGRIAQLIDLLSPEQDDG